MRKFLISLLLLLVAVELELTLGAMGIFISLTLGILVACACELPFWAFMVLDLIAAIIFRAGSLVDLSLFVLVLFPLVIAFFHRSVLWESWALVPIAAGLGAFFLALVSDVPLGAIGIAAIIEDVAVTGIVGLLGYGLLASQEASQFIS